jgi:benzoyl-CoA reductase/2-hydroxyglutaryl-CoA dehydratase subunit BcrC/BadD/HgdB
MESSRTILTKLFTDYYLSAAQAKKEGRPIAYITAFTPVEILRAMDITCLYPESYAVVCSASGKAQEMIEASGMAGFSGDLCSYSLISFGMDGGGRLPYGGLPEPDLLIATNNQCGTTLLWFRLWAQRKNIPLFVIDYPAAADDGELSDYVRQQYHSLIEFLTAQTGRTLDRQKLAEQISNGRTACRLWAQLHTLNQSKSPRIDAAKLVNTLFPIVAAKGSEGVCRYYEALIREHSELTQDTDSAECLRLLWHGYPMWFLPARFPAVFDSQFQIVLNDYTLWWDLKYPQEDSLESLIAPYADTYLNWPLNRKLDWADTLISDYAIDGVILHANRSCRRALSHLLPLREHLKTKGIPSVMIESDMANPDYYSPEQIKLKIESFKESLKTA